MLGWSPILNTTCSVDLSSAPTRIAEGTIGVNLDPRVPCLAMTMILLAALSTKSKRWVCVHSIFLWAVQLTPITGKNPNWFGAADQPHISIDDLLVFAEKLGAEVYYNVNMAGGD